LRRSKSVTDEHAPCGRIASASGVIPKTPAFTSGGEGSRVDSRCCRGPAKLEGYVLYAGNQHVGPCVPLCPLW
jgi:hypothetical protein